MKLKKGGQGEMIFLWPRYEWGRERCDKELGRESQLRYEEIKVLDEKLLS